MTKAEFKTELLSLLQDPEVRDTVLQIVHPNIPQEKQTTPPEQSQHEGDEEMKLLEKIKELQDKLFGTEQALDRVTKAKQQTEAENQQLKQDINYVETQAQQELSAAQAKAQNQINHTIAQAEQQLNALESRSEQEISSLKSKAQEEKQSLQGQITQLRGDNSTLQRELSSLQAELQSAQSVIAKFEAEQASFKLYQNLPSSIKTDLRRVFHQETFENFVACSAQKDTVDALWTYTKTRIFNRDLDSVEALAEIFRFSLHCHNSTSETPVLHLIDAPTGGKFDNEFHLGTPDSAKAGMIETALFSGYAIGRDKKIKQKAIVVIG